MSQSQKFDSIFSAFGDLAQYKVIIKLPQQVDPIANIANSLNKETHIVETFNTLDEAVNYKNQFLKRKQIFKTDFDIPCSIEIRAYGLDGSIKIFQSDGTWVPLLN